MANAKRIARAYSALNRRATRRDRRVNVINFSQSVRIGEIKRVLRDFYGELENDKEGRALFAILLHSIVSIGSPARKLMRCQEERAEFAPWLSDDAFERMADQAIKRPRRWRADLLAQRLGVTDADRTRLKLHTIGATDCDKEERARLRQERWNAKRRKQTRAEYEGPASARRLEAAALGITVEALRKRQQRAAKTDVPSPRQYKGYIADAHFGQRGEPMTTNGEQARAQARATDDGVIHVVNILTGEILERRQCKPYVVPADWPFFAHDASASSASAVTSASHSRP
jgi:hypothetical protein